MDNYNHIVATTSQWTLASYKERIIPRGTLCVELVNPGLTKIKVGVGNKHFRDLPYIAGDADLSNYYTKEETNQILEELNRMKIASTNIYEKPENLPKNGNHLGDVRFVKNPDSLDNPNSYVWNNIKWIPLGGGSNHTHANKEILDETTAPFTIEDQNLIDLMEIDVNDLKAKSHTHENKDILDETTAPFTQPEKEKLAKLKVLTPFIGTNGSIDGEEGLVPQPLVFDVGKFLCANGNWETINVDVDTYIGATIDHDGIPGLVPAALSAQRLFFLRGDGNWIKVRNGATIYKAGDGITIVSTEVVTETIPFEIYAKAQWVEQYVIYGSSLGVGDIDWSVGGKYLIPVVVTSDGELPVTFNIVLDGPLNAGDYVDYENRVWATNRTNITFPYRSGVNPSGSVWRSVSENDEWNVNPQGVYEYGFPSGFKGGIKTTFELELEQGADYFAGPWSMEEGYWNSGYTWWGIGFFDADHNPTHRITIYNRGGSTQFNLQPNDVYVRLVIHNAEWENGTFHLYKIETNRTELPVGVLPRMSVYSNKTNIISVNTTNPPAQMFVKVEDPPDEEEDPLAQVLGTVYNDGIIDATQHIETGVIETTFMFRDSSKNITLDTYFIKDIYHTDIDVSASTLTIVYPDGSKQLKTADRYVGQNGITVERIRPPMSPTEWTAINKQWFFDTPWHAQVEIPGAGGRYFGTNQQNVQMLAAMAYWGPRTREYSRNVIVVSPVASTVQNCYWGDYPSAGNRFTLDGSFEHRGLTWYYGVGAGYYGYWEATGSAPYNCTPKQLGVIDSVSTAPDPVPTTELAAAKLLIEWADVTGISDVPVYGVSNNIGDGLTVVNDELTLAPATTTTIGGIIVGSGLSVDASGVLSTSGSTTDTVTSIVQTDPTTSSSDLTITYSSGTVDTFDVGDKLVGIDGIYIEKPYIPPPNADKWIADSKWFFNTTWQCYLGINGGRPYQNEVGKPMLLCHAFIGTDRPYAEGIFVVAPKTDAITTTKWDYSYQNHYFTVAGSVTYMGMTWYYSNFDGGGSTYFPSGTAYSCTPKTIYNLPIQTSLANAALALLEDAHVKGVADGLQTGIGINTGDGLSVDGNNDLNVIPATTTDIGGVIVGDGLNIDNTGVLSATPFSIDLFVSYNGLLFDADRTATRGRISCQSNINVMVSCTMQLVGNEDSDSVIATVMIDNNAFDMQPEVSLADTEKKVLSFTLPLSIASGTHDIRILAKGFADLTNVKASLYGQGFTILEPTYSTDYTYTITDDEATITRYNGSDVNIEIPEILGGSPVVTIDDAAFTNNTDIETVYIPDGLEEIL